MPLAALVIASFTTPPVAGLTLFQVPVRLVSEVGDCADAAAVNPTNTTPIAPNRMLFIFFMSMSTLIISHIAAQPAGHLRERVGRRYGSVRASTATSMRAQWRNSPLTLS